LFQINPLPIRVFIYVGSSPSSLVAVPFPGFTWVTSPSAFKTGSDDTETHSPFDFEEVKNDNDHFFGDPVGTVAANGLATSKFGSDSVPTNATLQKKFGRTT